MADIYFPQLSSGAICQFPIRKSKLQRTVSNVLSDGRFILLPDPAASTTRWELTYSHLSLDETNVLQSHFRLCRGALRRFVFLDPVDNLMSSSSDLQSSCWNLDSQLLLEPGISDPHGGDQAFRLTNLGQSQAEISQQLQLPANYVYAFSMYIRGASESDVTQFRRSNNDSSNQVQTCTPEWNRITLSGALVDRDDEFYCGVTLQPGQQIEVYGPQLEPQWASSCYRATKNTSGIYRSAHLDMEEMFITCDGPNSFSTTMLIEAAT